MAQEYRVESDSLGQVKVPVAARYAAQTAVADFVVNTEVIDANLARNPILVTALNRAIGYSKAAEIAKRAYREGRPIIDVAIEMTDLGAQRLAQLLDPANLV